MNYVVKFLDFNNTSYMSINIFNNFSTSFNKCA